MKNEKQYGIAFLTCGEGKRLKRKFDVFDLYPSISKPGVKSQLIQWRK